MYQSLLLQSNDDPFPYVPRASSLTPTNKPDHLVCLDWSHHRFTSTSYSIRTSSSYQLRFGHCQ